VQPVLGELNRKARGILVGESPGSRECETGKPFTGPTGAQLDEELAETARIARHDFAVINAIACKPTTKSPVDMGRAASACQPLFTGQLALLPDVPVLAMGRWAGFAVTGCARGISGGKRAPARGFIRYEQREPRTAPVILTWHPTYAFFKSPWNWAEFSIDLDRFARLCRGELQPEEFDVNIAPTVGDIKRLVAESEYLTVDVETAPCNPEEPWTGKDPTRARLKSVAIGNAERALAHWWGRNHSVERYIAKVLADPTILKVWVNGEWFDRRVMKRFKLPVANVVDVRDMRRACSTTSKVSLGYQASIMLDFPAWKEMDAQEDEK
jgi:uracil-DNA glycosylase family 4